MLGAILAQQSLVLVLVHVGLLALARDLGERRWPPPRVVGGVGVVLATTALGLLLSATGFTGHAFFAAQLVIFFGFACAAAAFAARDRLFAVLLHLAFFAALVRFLFWRGLLDLGGPTLICRYIFQDFAAQLLLPAIGALVAALSGAGDGLFLAALRRGVHYAAGGVVDHLLLFGGLLTYAIAVAAAHAVTGNPLRASARRLRHGYALHLGLACFVAANARFGAGSLAPLVIQGAILPFYVAEALLAIDGLARLHLRSGRLILLALLSAVPFASGLLYGLAVAGFVHAIIPVVPDAGARSGERTRVPLRRWAAAGAVACVAFGLVALASGRVLDPGAALPPPAQLCPQVAVQPGQDEVRFDANAARRHFWVDRRERALESRAPDDADAVCAAEGKRLCRSDELYLVCACDHGRDGYPRDSFSPQPRDALTQRARRACLNPRYGRDPEALCATDHGVEELLGNRSEVTGTRVAGAAYLVAGPNRWFNEDWMVHCSWRSVVSDVTLAADAYPMLGFRCCRDGD